MYDERRIADSIRACKDAKMFYQTTIFENPKNIFDLDTYLPYARKEVVLGEMEQPKRDPDFERRLQEAIEFGDAIRRERGQKTAPELAAEAAGVVSELEHAQAMMETQPAELMGQEVVGEAILTKKEIKRRKKQEKAREKEEKLERKFAKKQAKERAELDKQLANPQEEEAGFGRVLLHRFVELVVCVAIAFCLSAGFNHHIGTHTVVDGTSMENTLQDGDNLYVDKISYEFHEPKRFDIIVFPYNEDEYYIKRIIGMPGETVEIRDGVIYIDGNVLAESYGAEPLNELEADFPVTNIGSDEYFVLGDNRNYSKDSRSNEVGMIKREKIVGKATWRLFPFDGFGKLQ